MLLSRRQAVLGVAGLASGAFTAGPVYACHRLRQVLGREVSISRSVVQQNVRRASLSVEGIDLVSPAIRTEPRIWKGYHDESEYRELRDKASAFICTRNSSPTYQPMCAGNGYEVGGNQVDYQQYTTRCYPNQIFRSSGV